jgi:hypothetical protein
VAALWYTGLETGGCLVICRTKDRRRSCDIQDRRHVAVLWYSGLGTGGCPIVPKTAGGWRMSFGIQNWRHVTDCLVVLSAEDRWLSCGIQNWRQKVVL